MYKNKKILGLITARSRSKGLPNKNVKFLAGKPLIAWTVEAALDSKYLDKVIVSTDDKKIAAIASKFGAEVPFLRPAVLATSKAKMIDVLMHALDFIVKRGDNFDLIMLLQPTSPLRETKDIDSAIELLFRKKAGAIVSVCKTDHHPWLAGVIPSSLSLARFIPKKLTHKNRQELPVYYRTNGAIYVSYIKYLIKHNDFFANKTYAYIMPFDRSVDIDNQLDFELAQTLKQKNKSRL